MPGVLGGGLLALTLSLDDVVITQFAAGPGSTTLPVYVFGLIRRGVTPLINAVSVVMLAVSVALVLLSLLLDRVRSGKREHVVDDEAEGLLRETVDPTARFDHPAPRPAEPSTS
jgi:ABC-type Fe3+ transport system permease subunit